MPDTPTPEGLAKFHNTHVRLADKMRHSADYPRADDVMRVRVRSRP